MRWMKSKSVLAAGALLALGMLPADAVGTVNIVRQVNVPAPPAAAFQGTTGGDGYDVTAVSGRVYTVWHHNEDNYQVACLIQTTGAACPGGWPKTITDPLLGGFQSPGGSYTWTNAAHSKLYGWAIKHGSYGGVICVDLTAPDSELNPYCGFTKLTHVGTSNANVDGWIYNYGGNSDARVGDRVYTTFGLTGKTYLACFDVATGAECTGGAIELDFSGAVAASATSKVLSQDNRLYVSAAIGSNTYLTCWDVPTATTCNSANVEVWPALASATTGGATPAPIIDASGAMSGICALSYNALDTTCFDELSGATMPVPSAYASGLVEYQFVDAPLVLGSRVLLVNTGASSINCIDFSTGTGTTCTGFPFVPQSANLLYTISEDVERPGCIWLNSDNGTQQIQNFDAYTGTSGCEGRLRVATTQFVNAPTTTCGVANWDSLRVTTPSTWTTGTVKIANGTGTLLSGGNITLRPSGNSLSEVSFSGVPNPIFTFEFTGANIPSTGIAVTFVFTVPELDTCKIDPQSLIYVPTPEGQPDYSDPLYMITPLTVASSGSSATSLTCDLPALNYPRPLLTMSMWFTVNGKPQAPVAVGDTRTAISLPVSKSTLGAVVNCHLQVLAPQHVAEFQSEQFFVPAPLEGLQITSVMSVFGFATVTWNEVPGADHYSIKSIPEGLSCSTTTIACTMTGVQPKTWYKLTLTASGPHRESVETSIALRPSIL